MNYNIIVYLIASLCSRIHTKVLFRRAKRIKLVGVVIYLTKNKF